MREQANRRESTGQRPLGETSQAAPTPADLCLAEASAPVAAGVKHPQRQPRLRTVDRQQILPAMPLDQIIETDHPARSVWCFVTGLDLSLLYQRIRSRVNTPGRPPTDPRVLIALWLYAILYGVVSARRVAELSRHHNAFRWLRGGVPLNHHLLSDFLVEHVDFLQQLFTQSVAVLQQQGLVDLSRVGQDGMRVRASAGAASFRRRATLEKLLQQAQQQVPKLRPPGAQTVEPEVSEVTPREEVAIPQAVSDSAAARPTAAQQRAARERLQRLQQALQRLPEMEAKKKTAEKKSARVSTTDPEATLMKMADGGYRPAYNFQFSTTCDHQVIVGVEVVTAGSDQGQLPPMLDQIAERFQSRPKEVLVDGGFAKHEDIEAVQQGVGEKTACQVYAPVQKPKKEGLDRHAPHPGDSPQVAEWRQRMGTAAAQEIYKERAATAECVNAQARNRGLLRMLVRGLEKARAFALWFATVHNVARGLALLPQQTATAGQGLLASYA